MRWEKTGRKVYKNGGSDTTYTLKEFPELEVQSRKRPVSHANGEGYWMATSYFVVEHGTDVKEFWRLSEAKEYAESIVKPSETEHLCMEGGQ